MIQNKQTRNQTYVDGDFTTWKKCSSEKVSFPFEGNQDSYMMDQEYMGYADYYFENLPAIGQAHPEYSGLYFTGDSQQSDMGCGISKVTRTYAILPGFNTDNMGQSTNVRVEAESFIWTKPGINTTNAGNAEVSNIIKWYIDNVTDKPVFPDATTVTLSTTINPSTGLHWDHDLNSNYQICTILYGINDPLLGWREFEYQTEIISRTATSITVEKVAFNIGTAPDPLVQYIYFSRPQIKINPRQVVVQSYNYYTYYLPGVNCTTIEDIPIEQPWRILDQNLNEVDSVSETTSPPLYTDGLNKGYYNMIADGDKILVDFPTVRRWRGTILEKQSRYITII